MSDSVEFIDLAALRQILFPTGVRSARMFFEAMIDERNDRTSPLVDNIVTNAHLMRVGIHLMTVTVNDADLDNSWVCLPEASSAAVRVPRPSLSQSSRCTEESSRNWRIVQAIC